MTNTPSPTDELIEERRIASEEAFARKLLAERERDLGFTGYADWLDGGCPAGTEHEYPHERIADVCFYVKRAADRLESLLSDRAKLEEALEKLARQADETQGEGWVYRTATAALNRSTDRAT